MSKVCCARCGQTIEEKEDLVTSIYGGFIRIQPSHSECYAQSMRGKEGFFMNRTPLNGKLSMFLCLVALICMIWFLFESFYLLAIVMLIPIILRITSWISYERAINFNPKM